MIAKRERGKLERQLVASLTDACEQAKAEVPGFVWLTHCVDYQHFPDSLVVIWVFDTDAHLASALKGDAKQRLHELTASALAEAGVALDSVARHIDFDSEQACQRAHGGDWQRRLRSRAVRH
ncbi:hypothetical protein [Vreelandella populi]|uniref:Fis family transcriptional regulator n=1 Tax=Vreelandella populi TaxID=2498858 RepID=A0A3S1E8M5_9GAMM|nr:hypothetical protein [Halomonas populi]RUR35316.1 hypothetical protein ELY25_15025 [Halomonas populi]RUR47507.1 hypothetical protein ELY37_04380 [Halomonas populi]